MSTQTTAARVIDVRPIPIGAAIDDLRKRLGWNGCKLARRSGLSQSYVSGVIQGHRNIGIENVERFARALGMSTCALVRYAELMRDAAQPQQEAQHGA